MRLSIAVALLCVSVPAGAQSLVPGPNQGGRYEMQPIDGGVARLDTVTGEISLCRVVDDVLRCRPSQNDRDAATKGHADPSPGTAPLSHRATPGAVSPTPDDEDDVALDRAIERMKRVFRAFGDISREFRDDRAPDAPALPDRT